MSPPRSISSAGDSGDVHQRLRALSHADDEVCAIGGGKHHYCRDMQASCKQPRMQEAAGIGDGRETGQNSIPSTGV